MISRLRLLGFQAHEDLTVELGMGVTTLVGPSDAGKSSVVRALYWVAFNRPLGDGFVRRGAPGAEVRVWVDAKKVKKKRSGQNSYYAVDGEVFRASGKNVPDPVRDLLNVGPDNFQRQHDPLFWVGQSPSEVARHLNAVVSLDLIDHSLAEAARGARDAKARAELCEERLNQAERERDRLVWTESLDAKLTSAENMAREAAQDAARIARLTSMLGSYQELTRTLQTATKARQMMDGLDDTVARYEESLAPLQAARELLDRAARLRTPQKKVDIRCLEAAMTAHQDSRSRLEKARSLLAERRRILQRIKEEGESASKLRQELGSLPCPTCGRLPPGGP